MPLNSRAKGSVGERELAAFSIRIDGTPAPMPRAKVAVIGNRGRGYNPTRTSTGAEMPWVAWRDAVVSAVDEALTDDMPWTGPLAMSLDIIIERPEGHYRKGGALAKGAEPWPHKSGGDVDNFCKLLIDAMQQQVRRGMVVRRGVFKNDRQIVEYRQPFRKRWAVGDEPSGAVVKVWRIEA